MSAVEQAALDDEAAAKEPAPMAGGAGPQSLASAAELRSGVATESAEPEEVEEQLVQAAAEAEGRRAAALGALQVAMAPEPLDVDLKALHAAIGEAEAAEVADTEIQAAEQVWEQAKEQQAGTEGAAAEDA